jgi:NTE family protein
MSHLASPESDAPLQADVVLEGGGVRGIGHVGALCVAEEQGYQWVNVAGTSAGAFVAAMLAAGYSAQEMYIIMRDEVDFSRFAQDRGLDGLVPVEALHLFRQGGIHTGSYIEAFMREKMKAKGVTTFGDLVIRKDEPKDSNSRYRLTVIASDISSGQMLRLPQDMHQYGLDADKVDIALAVRMSASIPFFFIPVAQKHNDGRNCLIVDGGLLSNFPVYLFDVPGQPRHPTFGLRLVDSLPTASCPWPFNQTDNILQITHALLQTMMTAHDRLYMDDHTYVRTIAIPVNGISGTKFNLTRQEAETLYQNGRAAAQDFLSTWDFDAYKATFRGGQPQKSRRARLHEQMKLAG